MSYSLDLSEQQISDLKDRIRSGDASVKPTDLTKLAVNMRHIDLADFTIELAREGKCIPDHCIQLRALHEGALNPRRR